ncbi:hypothetical protein M5K25_019717 [Dendrobium thyrsiflorum]|uniref:DUF7866 domain-containing protein n=1 Tax=Dendrobium thyrsiflorum TaxID=117978 RepID=A0ABD0UFQ5_DENTH
MESSSKFKKEKETSSIILDNPTFRDKSIKKKERKQSFRSNPKLQSSSAIVYNPTATVEYRAVDELNDAGDGQTPDQPFQLCLTCQCCPVGDPTACLSMPCCFGIDCDLPNKPYGNLTSNEEPERASRKERDLIGPFKKSGSTKQFTAIPAILAGGGRIERNEKAESTTKGKRDIENFHEHLTGEVVALALSRWR